MNVLFIEKERKSSKIKDKLNIVSKKDNKIRICYDKSKFKSNQIIARKIKKIVCKNSVDKIVLSKELKENKDLINLLYSNNIKISNDRWLFKMLTDKVIEKVMENRKRQESEIWITVNDIDTVIQNTIYKFSKEFRRVNIITNHISKFKKIEEKLYEEEGIILTVTNNRRKSLLKANLILNIDFPKELLNQFAIFEQAIIVNIEGDMFIKKKRFSGKVINDIEIKSYEDEVIDKFICDNKLENYDIKNICEILNIVPKCDIILR